MEIEFADQQARREALERRKSWPTPAPLLIEWLSVEGDEMPETGEIVVVYVPQNLRGDPRKIFLCQCGGPKMVVPTAPMRMGAGGLPDIYAHRDLSQRIEQMRPVLNRNRSWRCVMTINGIMTSSEMLVDPSHWARWPLDCPAPAEPAGDAPARHEPPVAS